MGDGPARRTLAARLADRDRSRFTGRAAELAFLERCLDDADPPASVVLITGPGGIGKSTLLREAARRARDRGISVVAIDGRELGPAPEMLEAALRDAARHTRPLVLLDSYERMTALGPYLRRELLPGLPDQALVVIAGRGTPDPGWFTGGWESVTARLDLDVLEPRDARHLLAAYGLDDRRVPDIVDWAAGSPLALALAADAALADADWNAATGPDRPDIIKSLLHRLVETELHDIRPSALGIAVVARTTTRDLVRGVLSDEDAETGYRQLSGLTVTEPLGDGFTMHELVRKALLADLRQRNPELERDLRRRIVDYLYARAKAGEPLLLIDLVHLVEDPLKRWGFGWDGNVSFRIDNVRGDDAARIEAGHGDRQPQLWWQLTRRFFTESPEHVAVARDRGDQICGYMACMTPATAPAFADTDPLIGPWLAHARREAPRGDSVLWHAAVDFTGQAKVQAMLGMAGVLRTGTGNMRFAYLPIDPAYPGAAEFAQAIGAAHLTELDAEIGGQQVHCYRLDYGPAGLLDHLRDAVYSELGLLAPPPAGPAVDLETVREVLKNFRVPRELARSPLAVGTTVQARAESVRRLVRDGARQAFGDSETEKLLHSVLVYGYLDPLRSHEEAASRLCLSRAAYFRRLRTAVERLAEYLAAAPLP
jgi:AAA ATPase domain